LPGTWSFLGQFMTGKALTFFSRLLSTVVLWTVSLAIILSGNQWGFLFLIFSLSMIGLWEFYTMLDHKGLPNFKIIGMLCGALLILGSFYWCWKVGVGRSYDFELAVMLLFVLIVFARQMFEKMRDIKPLETMAFTLFGIFYVPWLFNFITKIVFLLPGQGHLYVLFCIVITKFSDMGAYLTGSVIGRHPLIPHISPKKTWEGFFGALLFAVGGACAYYALVPQIHRLAWVDVIVLGLLLGFAAIVGDLAESILKRSTDVKDSGNFLPGIGGTLDLIDSLLFTAPLLFFYLRIVVGIS
jgi:phosphatidate cytidylyltransferase